MLIPAHVKVFEIHPEVALKCIKELHGVVSVHPKVLRQSSFRSEAAPFAGGPVLRGKPEDSLFGPVLRVHSLKMIARFSNVVNRRGC